ncbi:MAG: tRNA 2-selenouridine(34) synthase MnmH [Burkholderiales bacterium]
MYELLDRSRKTPDLKFSASANVSQLGSFDEIIDTRSASEFALDHLPGAINLPVLNDEERARIGILYKQSSSFDAKKAGAALVAHNIAQHIEAELYSRQKNWRPLVYCWRGGNRSASMGHVLRQIGWDAYVLDGGYKSYRRHVIAGLETLPQQLQLRVVCGPTGSGKSRLLQAIAEAGGQALDLEDLAAHRGSVLGNLPDCRQPSQKLFETNIWDALRKFDSAQPVFIEAESKKIGTLRVPEALIQCMWRSPCILVDVPMAARVNFLKQDYAHFLADHSDLEAKLSCLHGLYGAEKIDHWLNMARQRQWDTLVEELLRDHYDPAYRRSTLSHYIMLAEAETYHLRDINGKSLLHIAYQILE